MGLLGSMTVRFGGDTSGLKSAVSNVQGMLKGLPAPIAAASVGFLALGAVAVGVGIKATKMAAAYQQSLNMVQALTGSSTSQMRYYDQAVKSLAISAGVGPTALTKGLYNVMSAGYRGAEAVQVLTLATQDSKIGMTDAATTTDALTNILRSFSVKAQDATRVNGEMLETVTLGKSTFEQYASVIVKSASAAVQFHVSMETMNAAWATMTSSGIRAAQASTDFQASIKVMYGNIGTVTKALEKNGIAFDENKFNTMSYGDKVVYLNNALQQAVDKHVKITGVTLQASQAISTIANHIGDYNNNLKTLSDRQAMANKTAQAWAITQSGFNQQWSRFQAAIDVFMIRLGTVLLPYLSSFMQTISNHLGDLNNLVDWISNFIGWVQKGGPAVSALTTAFTTLAIAVAGLKLASVLTALGGIITSAPQAAAKLLLVQGAAESVAGAEGVAAIGANAATAEGVVAKAAAGMTLSLGGVLSMVGFVAAAEIGLAMWLRNNNIVPKAPTANMPSWVTHTDRSANGGYGNNGIQQVQDLLGAVKKLAQVNPFDPNAWQQYSMIIAQTQKQIDDLNHKQQQLPGPIGVTAQMYQQWENYLKNGGTQAFTVWRDAQYRANEAFLGNLSKARDSIDQTANKLQKLNGPYNPIVKTAGISDARQQAIDTANKLAKLNGPYKPVVDSSGLGIAQANADTLRNHLLALNGPYNINVDSTVHVNLDGKNVTTQVMNNAVSQMRSGLGNRR